MPGWSIPTTPSGTKSLSPKKIPPTNAPVPVCSVATVPSVVKKNISAATSPTHLATSSNAAFFVSFVPFVVQEFPDLLCFNHH